MKTLSELEAMDDDELRVMLAEARGYRWSRDDQSGRIILHRRHAGNDWTGCERPSLSELDSPDLDDVPKWPEDLNACHAVFKTLDYDQSERFEDNLCDVSKRDNERSDNPYQWRVAVTNATARQRTIALILTLQQEEAK